jgi:hypothetical protein
LQAQFAALQALGVTQARTEALLARLESAQKSCTGAAALLDRLRNPEPSGYRRPAELSEQIAYLRYIIGQYDGGATQVQQQLIDRYAAQLQQIEGEAARTCP